MNAFAGIEERYAQFENAQILLQPLTYDGTSTWGKGADKGFAAFMEAAANMELYDIETDSEVYRRGIHTLASLDESGSAEEVCAAIRGRAREMIASGKFPTFFGGEHSVSIGIIQAFAEKYPDLTVLQLDAHADLRPDYEGSACNHACAVHWAARNCNLIQVGIRSMDSAEKDFMQTEKTFLAHEISSGDADWMERSIALMGAQVYLTIDLDVFDPAIMPATGTPEPGGLDWNTVTRYLRKLCAERRLLGFDIVELAPIEGLRAPDFLAAKLYYKLLSYRFSHEG